MGQILVCQLDDAAIERLKVRARGRNTSVEALAREAIHKAAALGVEENRSLFGACRNGDAGRRFPVLDSPSASI